MKRILLLMLSSTLLLSCSYSSEKKIIREVAYNYAYALANYNVDEAENYATEETRSLTLAVARNMITAVGSEYIKSDTPAEIEIRSVEIINDTVAKTVYHKTTPLKDFSDTLYLRKRNGEWLAHVLIPVVKKDQQQIEPSKGTPKGNAPKDNKPQQFSPELLKNTK